MVVRRMKVLSALFVGNQHLANPLIKCGDYFLDAVGALGDVAPVGVSQAGRGAAGYVDDVAA